MRYAFLVNFPKSLGCSEITEHNFNVKHVRNEIPGQFYFFANMEIGFDKIFDAIEYNIAFNQDAEAKVNLLKEKINELKDIFETEDIETLKTTEIPVEAIKQVLNEDIETLKTTEIPVEAIKQVLNEDVETLKTIEVPIIKSEEPYEPEEENSVPVIEQSYTVEIPKLGLTLPIMNTSNQSNPKDHR